MSVSSVESLGPILVSELPPVRFTPRVSFARLRSAVLRRGYERAFDRALRGADHAQHGDLMAAARRN